MTLLFKTQMSLVTFSLMLKVKVPDIQMRKDTWYHKTFEKHRKIRKIKIHMWTASLNTQEPFFHHWRHENKDKVQMPQRTFLYSCGGELIQT